MTLKELTEMERLEAIKKCGGDPVKVAAFGMLYTKHKDTDTKSLTKAVIRFLELKGHQAEPVENKGGYIPGKEIGVGFYGVKRTAGKRIYSPNKNGTADVHCTVFGRVVKCEIKCATTKDRVRPKQIEYAESIRKAGGQYWIVRNFADLVEQYNKFISTL